MLIGSTNDSFGRVTHMDESRLAKAWAARAAYLKRRERKMPQLVALHDRMAAGATFVDIVRPERREDDDGR